ncbi:hypothetical protein CLTEP_05520 [Clostridium tepidiprofundi DSM 19306]|uniref:Helix-turn-helix domain protein n=1 Tax=Clostridium tepidiprofundi DSM 19306 TaxID=1121338 RepID=A0A151B645_9CLOT|nr:helix-turn-helix domain-containing protein [Clostridium tepidiprofundi]KYH35376.1 hypothetical protein CLTEP_05520 [Clostridium tepidiprofundi DSM 19306]
MPGFTFIDNDGVLDNEDLNIQEQSLLIALISYYNEEKGYAYPSYKQLMQRSKIKSKTTFINTLNSLISNKYIKRDTIKGKGCRYYINEFILSTDIDQVQKCTNTKYRSVPTRGTDIDQHMVQKCTNTKYRSVPTRSTDIDQHQVQKCTTTNTITNKINNKINIDDFEELWKLYPNKKGKAKARQIVTKLLKKYTKEELQRCIERYSKEVQGKDKQYILHGSTFFNGRYEDYLDNNYTEQNESFEEQKTKEAYAQLEYLKGEITFD